MYVLDSPNQKDQKIPHIGDISVSGLFRPRQEVQTCNPRVLFFHGSTYVGQDLLIIVDSRSHSDTQRSVGLLWTSDQLDAATSTWQLTILSRTDIHAPGGIRTRNRSKRAAADPCLRTRGHRDRIQGNLGSSNGHASGLSSVTSVRKN